MSNQVKIALIVCDTPVVAEEGGPNPYGTYKNLFNDQLEASLAEYKKTDNPGAQYTFSGVDAFDVVGRTDDEAYPKLDNGNYSGIIISGSRHDAFAGDAWITKLVSWTKAALDRQKEVIVGSCFGHQIMAIALGGTCQRSDNGWEAGATEITLSKDGKGVFKTTRPTLSIHQMHSDVITLPKGCTSLASTKACSIQAFIKPKQNGKTLAFSVQGHPEFNRKVVFETVNILEKRGKMDKAAADQGRANSEKPHDGAGIIGRAMWRAILGDQ